MTVATGSDLISSGTSVHSITHNLASDSVYVTALVPNWNTTVWTGSRGSNSTTIYFGTQTTSSGGSLAWRVEV